MSDEPVRWTAAAAGAWYAGQPWLVGCNFIPSYAVNQLEMWQAATFDLAAIDRELALAASIGMNCARIYLHDLLWRHDAPAFVDRIDAVLDAAAARGIGVVFVLFDSCWDPVPRPGPQPPPRRGVHNSRWVQSPGLAALTDAAQRPRLAAYVEGVVGRFADDPRVLVWDVWNEPDNGPEVAGHDRAAIAVKSALVVTLLEAAFGWTRAMSPRQPVTSGVWLGDWSAPDRLNPTQTVQLAQSDIVTFHNYDGLADFARRAGWLAQTGRPVLCTEFMARPRGSTIATILPWAKANGVAALCWGLVSGRTQTDLPWDSWDQPCLDGPVGPSFHDLFDAAGAPYDPAEIALIRRLAA